MPIICILIIEQKNSYDSSFSVKEAILAPHIEYSYCLYANLSRYMTINVTYMSKLM